jgi:hypothetical protein
MFPRLLLSRLKQSTSKFLYVEFLANSFFYSLVNDGYQLFCRSTLKSHKRSWEFIWCLDMADVRLSEKNHVV